MAEAAGMQLLPLDLAILALLPTEGSMLGYHNLGMQAKALVRKLSTPEAPVTAAQVGGRLRELKRGGYTCSVPVQPLNEGLGWQATKQALDALAVPRG